MNAPATNLSAPEQHLDDESLLAALTLAPGVYSRNRMFDLYEQNGRAKLLRARANRLRGVVRMWHERADATLSLAPHEGGVEIGLDVPSMAYRRSLRVTEFERGLLALLLEKALAAAPERSVDIEVNPLDRARVQAALSRLTV